MSRVFVVVLLVWIFIYTASFGKWTWKKNKTGAVMVFILALSALVLPIYAAFFRE